MSVQFILSIYLIDRQSYLEFGNPNTLAYKDIFPIRALLRLNKPTAKICNSRKILMYQAGFCVYQDKYGLKGGAKL